MSNNEVKLQELASQLANLKVLQVNKLATILKEEYGIEPAIAAAPIANNAATQESKQEEKAKFNVVLKSVGPAKLKVIKAIKEITKLGLKESKEIADNLGIVQKDLGKAAANSMKDSLEAEGAEVTIE